ncbi:MAG: hypothetical protein V3V14_09835, partial [Saprospiraceae bacterium]
MKLQYYISAILFFILINQGNAQIDNDNINYDVYGSIFYYIHSANDDSGTEQQILKIYNTTTSTSVLIHERIKEANIPTNITTTNQGDQLGCAEGNNSNIDSIKLTFDAWEHDIDPVYVFNAGIVLVDDSPCGAPAAEVNIIFRNHNPMQSNSLNAFCSGVGDQSGTFKFAYRYTAGDKESDPLNFSTISDNTTNTHINRINLNPGYFGATGALLDYTSTKNTGGFNGANEIFYTFTIDSCRRVIITTNTSPINDSPHVMKLAPYTGSAMGTIITTSSNKTIDQFLPAGDYIFSIEGSHSALITTKVQVVGFNTIDPGAILYQYYDTTYQGYVPLLINSNGVAIGDYSGTIWQRSSSGNTESFIDIPESSAWDYYPTSSDISLGTNVFRRKAFQEVCSDEDAYTNEVSIYTYPKNGFVDGTISASGGGGPVSGVTVTLTNVDNIEGLGGPGITTLTTMTNNNGYYSFSDFYVGNAPKNWKVTPTLSDHDFSPSSNTFSLHISNTPNTSQKIDVDFTDLSSFTFSGKVTNVSSSNCGMAGVVIYREFDGNGFLPIDTTDENGDYSIAILNIGNWKIKPILPGHTFTPLQFNGYIDGDKTKDFSDVSTKSLTVKLRGGCDRFIGTGKIRIKDTITNTCFDFTNEIIDNEGELVINLPAKPFEIELTSFSKVDGADQNIFNAPAILNYFDSQIIRIDLTYKDTILELTYHP